MTYQRRLGRNKAWLPNFLYAVSIIFNLYYPAGAQERTLAEKVEEYIAPYLRMGNFSGSILIAVDGQVLFSGACGCADYERGVANTPETRFQIGSLGKQFIAAAILLLQEKGMLSVGDPVLKYLPEYRHASRMTIHHLLCHTAGLPMDLEQGYGGESGSDADVPFLTLLNGTELLGEPGEAFNYSNAGYQLLYILVYAVSEEKPEDYIRKHIFEPLGMTDTVFYEGGETASAATGHFLLFDGPMSTAQYAPPQIGAIYTTGGDLFKWVDGLVGGRILGKESLEAMLTPNLDNYGYAWFVTAKESLTTISHGGAMPGFYSKIAHALEPNATVIVMGNLGNYPRERIVDDLLAMAIGRPYAIPEAYEAVALNRRLFGRYLGRYKAESGSTISVHDAGDYLFYIYIPQGSHSNLATLPRYILYPLGGGKFFCKDFDGQVDFTRLFEDRALKLIVTYNGAQTEFSRVESDQ